MIFQFLSSNPLLIIPFLTALLISFSVHEFCHALAAELLGDETPKSLGRLTLNPISHIDPLGFFLLFFAGFGWGKPVPFNPDNLKNQKWGSALVGLAGPLANLFIVIISSIALILLNKFGGLTPDSLLTFFLVILIQFNVILMVFNLIPVPPLDGSKIILAVLPDKYSKFKMNLVQYGPIILMGIILLDIFIPGLSLFGALFDWILNGVFSLI